jgi:hypothetical protein
MSPCSLLKANKLEAIMIVDLDGIFESSQEFGIYDSMQKEPAIDSLHEAIFSQTTDWRHFTRKACLHDNPSDAGHFHNFHIRYPRSGAQAA